MRVMHSSGEHNMVYIAKIVARLADKALAFRNNEDGLTLTEYVVTLGLLTAAVIAAVIGFGDALSGTWEAWATFITENTGPEQAEAGQ